MQLPRQPRPLELLCLDDTPHRVAAHLLGEVDGDGGAGRQRLGEAEIVLRERGCRVPELVVRDHDADRAAAHEQRYVEGRADAEAAGDVLVDFRVVEHRVDPLAAGAPSTRPAFDASIESSTPVTP